MSGVVLLDLFNTLVDDGGGAARDDVTRRMAGVFGVDPDAFTGLFHRRWRERLTGGYGPLAEMVRAFAAELGGAPDEGAVERAVRLRTGLASGLLGGAPAGTLAALERCGPREWRLGLVSNCTVETAQLWPARRWRAGSTPRLLLRARGGQAGPGDLPGRPHVRSASRRPTASTSATAPTGELAGAPEAGHERDPDQEFVRRPARTGRRPRIGALSQLLDRQRSTGLKSQQCGGRAIRLRRRRPALAGLLRHLEMTTSRIVGAS